MFFDKKGKKKRKIRIEKRINRNVIPGAKRSWIKRGFTTSQTSEGDSIVIDEKEYIITNAHDHLVCERDGEKIHVVVEAPHIIEMDDSCVFWRHDKAVIYPLEEAKKIFPDFTIEIVRFSEDPFADSDFKAVMIITKDGVQPDLDLYFKEINKAVNGLIRIDFREINNTFLSAFACLKSDYGYCRFSQKYSNYTVSIKELAKYIESCLKTFYVLADKNPGAKEDEYAFSVDTPQFMMDSENGNILPSEWDHMSVRNILMEYLRDETLVNLLVEQIGDKVCITTLMNRVIDGHMYIYYKLCTRFNRIRLDDAIFAMAIMDLEKDIELNAKDRKKIKILKKHWERIQKFFQTEAEKQRRAMEKIFKEQEQGGDNGFLFDERSDMHNSYAVAAHISRLPSPGEVVRFEERRILEERMRKRACRSIPVQE